MKYLPEILYLSMFIVAAFFVAIPFSFAATTYHLGCTEITNFAGGASCAANIVEFTSTQGYAYDSTNNMTSGTTWYLNFKTTGAVAGQVGNVNSSVLHYTPGTTYDLPYTPGVTGGFYIDNNDDHVGTIYDICFSDTQGDCFPAPPSPATTTVATTTYITSVNDDWYHLIILFLAGFYGMIWLFRKH